MSKRLKIIGVSALAALFAFAACEGPTGPAGGQGPTGPGGEQGQPGDAIASSYLRVLTTEHFNGANATVIGNVLVYDALDYIPLDQLPNPGAYFTPFFTIETLAAAGGENLTVSFVSAFMSEGGVRGTAAQSPFRLFVVDEEGFVLNNAGNRLFYAGAYRSLGNLARGAPPATTPAGIQGALVDTFLAAAGSQVTLAPGESARIAMVPLSPYLTTGETAWLGQTHRRAYIDLNYSLEGGAQRTMTIPMLLLRMRGTVHSPVFETGATAANTTVHAHDASMSAVGNLVWTTPAVNQSPVHGVLINHAGLVPEGYVVQSAFTGNPGTEWPPALTGPTGGVPVYPVGSPPPATPTLTTLALGGAITTTAGTLPLRDDLMAAGGAGWHWVSVASQGGHTVPIYPNRPALNNSRPISVNTARAQPFFMFVPHPIAAPVVTMSDEGMISITPIATTAGLAWTALAPFTFHIYRGDATTDTPRHIGTVTQAAPRADAAAAATTPLLFNLVAAGDLDVNQPTQAVSPDAATWLPAATVPIVERLWVGDNTITVRVQPNMVGTPGMIATAIYGQSAPAAAGIFRYAR